MINNVQVVVEQALPSEALLKKFPSLRHISSMKLRIIEDLLAEASDKVAAQKEAADRFSASELKAALEFYNHVVRDGRYVSLLGIDPKGAAQLLGTQISPKTIEILAYAKSLFAPETNAIDGTDIVVHSTVTIVVSIIICTFLDQAKSLAGTEAAEKQGLVVIDRSGQVKL